MKTIAGAVARVLVATDNIDDASQILGQLQDDFEHVRASTVAKLAVQDFDAHKPDVLLLAFDALEKAQRYYLGLYRLRPSLQHQPHRTVVLCTKDDVRAVFELCKQDYFDDYVLYWPHAHDGKRLAMSIWIACREVTAMRSESPRTAELRAHAQHVGELEAALDREFADGDLQIAAAHSSLAEAERDIAGAIDAFSDRLDRGVAAGWVDVKDRKALAREIDLLKEQQIAEVRRAGARSIEPVSAWTNRFRQQVAPAMAGARALTEKVRKIRPIVMVVDDDELVRQLVRSALDPATYDVVLVADGPGALSQLRRIRPDVILMDIGLPGLDGVSVVQRLKAAPDLASIPIIMMTGDSRRETLLRSVEVGAVAFVVKPFTRETLLTRLGKVLSRGTPGP